MLSEDKYISESGPEPVEVPHFIDDSAERDLSLLALYDNCEPPTSHPKLDAQVLYHEGLTQDQQIKSDPDYWPLVKCPTKSFPVFDRHGHFAYWQSCKSNNCVSCTPRKIRKVAAALGTARPQRAILITQVPGRWDVAHKLVKGFLRHVRRMGFTDFEWAYNIEENPRGSGFHLHAWHRGHDIPDAALTRMSESSGFGRAWSRPMKQPPGSPIVYSMKMAGVTDAPTRAQAVTQLRMYHDRNGVRLVNATDNMWLDQHGLRTTLTKAVREVSHRYRRSLGTVL